MTFDENFQFFNEIFKSDMKLWGDYGTWGDLPERFKYKKRKNKRKNSRK